jgi:hypothetical protein
VFALTDVDGSGDIGVVMGAVRTGVVSLTMPSGTNDDSAVTGYDGAAGGCVYKPSGFCAAVAAFKAAPGELVVSASAGADSLTKEAASADTDNAGVCGCVLKDCGDMFPVRGVEARAGETDTKPATRTLIMSRWRSL